jgi:simple sugar transport system permease protein
MPQIIALLLVLVVDSLVAPHFFQIVVQDGRLFGSPIDILNRAAPVALLAIGMTLVIATGGIDLSVGAVMAIAGATAASMTVAGHSLPVVLLVTLGTGVLAGLWNGVLVAILKIQPFVATLILMVAGRGVAQLITSGQIVTFNAPNLAWIGSGSLLFFPTRQGHVHATADREGYAVIAFFRADVDCFRTCVQHHRAHFEVIACAHAAGLGAVIGIFQPVTFGVEA